MARDSAEKRRAKELESAADESAQKNPKMALDLYKEAANVARQPGSGCSSSYKERVAYSLHDLGISFSESDEYELARDAHQEAVELRRILFAACPDMYCGDLSKSLHNYGTALNQLQLYSEAQKAYKESAELRRVLFTLHPGTHRAKLALSLSGLGFSLNKLKRYTEAHDAYREAIQLYQVLHTSNPEKYHAPLSGALEELGIALDELKLSSEAKAVYRELRVIKGIEDPLPASQQPFPRNTPAISSPLCSGLRSRLVFEDQDSDEQGVATEFTTSCVDAGSNDELTTLINVKWVPQPAGRGGYALVFRGTWNGLPVALKQLKPPRTVEKLEKRIRRECLIWQRQKHRNILPFLGIFTDTNNPDKFVYMISPWRENGNLQQFMEKNPDAHIVDMLTGVACALDYLHGQTSVVVHGDLRAANILVSDDHVPQLADFGLASLVHDPANGEPGLLSADTSTVNRGGAIRWLAPELFADHEVRPRFTPESDIYSFAMVIIEVFTNSVPFAHISQDLLVLNLVLRGERPPRPSHPRHSDALWECINRCWAQDPKERPSAKHLVPMLTQL